MAPDERKQLETGIASAVTNFEAMRREITGTCNGFAELFPDDPALEAASTDTQRSLTRLQAIVTSRLDGLLTREDA